MFLALIIFYVSVSFKVVKQLEKGSEDIEEKSTQVQNVEDIGLPGSSVHV